MVERGRGLRRDERAVSDFVSTLLLVALVVVSGAVVAVIVSSTLSAPAPPEASFVLSGVEAGDATLGISLRHGEPLEINNLRVLLQRPTLGLSEIPRESWTTPDPLRLRPGDVLTVPLDPPLAADERVVVRVAAREPNAVLAELAGGAGATTPAMPAPTLAASFTPDAIPADGASGALVEVRVSHPLGALAVSGVDVERGALARASGVALDSVPLRDDGRGGDRIGGDGVWSGIVTVPTSTPPETYSLQVNATDALGRLVATTQVSLETTFVQLSVAPPTTGESGAAAYSAGAEFSGPTSANVSRFLLRNWTWDRLHPERLDGDFMTVRVSGGGKAWNARVAFQEASGIAYATELLVWHDGAETRYAPDSGSTFLGGSVRGHRLDTLILNLTDPTADSMWVHSQYAAHPLALYSNAAITTEPRFVMPYFGHDITTGNEQSSIATGIISVEVVFV